MSAYMADLVYSSFASDDPAREGWKCPHPHRQSRKWVDDFIWMAEEPDEELEEFMEDVMYSAVQEQEVCRSPDVPVPVSTGSLAA